MKRTFLAFALSVLLIAALAACSSRPSDNANGNGSTNNGSTNNGTTGSDTSRPRPNTNSSGITGGNGSIADDPMTDDGVMDDVITDDRLPDDVVTDGEIVGDSQLNVDPVYHGSRTFSVSHHTWDYCADCNGNVVDFGDEATVGDNARRMVSSVTDGARRVGRMVSDMAYDMTHM